MKYHFVGVSFIGLLVLSGCGSAKTTGTPNANSVINMDNTAYKSQQAIYHGDVVLDVVGKVTNLPAFNQFYNDVQAGKSDKIRITSYTDEGDPIFMDLNFDGKIIQYTFDDSNDKFGGSNKGRKTTTCTGISAQQTVNGTMYAVTGCQDRDLTCQVLFISSSRR